MHPGPLYPEGQSCTGSGVLDELADAGVALEVVVGAEGDGVVVGVVATVVLNALVGSVVAVEVIGVVVALNVVGAGVVLEVAVCSIFITSDVSGGTGVLVCSVTIEQLGPLKPSSQMHLPSFPLHLPLSLQVVVALHLL